MIHSIKENYFTIVKLCMVGCLIGYIFCNNAESFQAESLKWFFCAVFGLLTVVFELIENKKAKYILLVLEVVLLGVILMVTKGIPEVYLLIPIIVLDLITVLKIPIWYGALNYIVVYYYSGNPFFAFFIITLILIIYVQQVQIILKERETNAQMSQKEFALKEHIDEQNRQFKEQVTKDNLSMENRVLEERNEIYQQLHDKLGHNINGSVYQLEAAKIMMKQQPDECEKILQAVIDKLRGSMDEIRMMFRKQKPSKKQMAILKLNQLCEECQNQYHIDASFEIEGEDRKIPENILEVILDNTYEAVSNALKYSECDKLSIRIVIMNQMLRCTIVDNGRGCESIKQGMGLQGMRSRMREVNGILNIDGSNGFIITMLFPMNG